MKNSNPPIKGHELLFEGRIRDRWYWWHPGTDEQADWLGGCRCGAKPDPFPCGANVMRRWHREHKAELRA